MMTFNGRFNLFYVAVFMIASCFTSCTQLDTFEKNTSIPNYEWKSSFECKGSFEITDANARYNGYIVLRHTDAYKYNNIWINLSIQPPGDSVLHQKINVELGTDATGWLGTGMNDIWEIRQLQFKAAKCKTGTYHFSISQVMRDDPLPAIMSAGFRLEKQQN